MMVVVVEIGFSVVVVGEKPGGQSHSAKSMSISKQQQSGNSLVLCAQREREPF